MALFDNFDQQFPNNPDISSEINTAVLGGTNVDGYQDAGQPDPNSQMAIDQFNAQFTPSPIGAQGASLYPGAGHNINVGNYSGSIVGSNPIFVPGGNVAAINPLLARQKAIDDAAKARAAALKPFDYGKPMELADARFQQKFNDTYYNRANQLVQDAKQKYGKEFSVVLQDPTTREGNEFRQEMANFEVLGKNFNQIVDLMAGVQAGLESGELNYSKNTMKLYDDFQNLVGNFEKGDVFKTGDLKTMYDQLKGHISLENYIQRSGFLDNIMGQVTQSPYDVDKGEFYKYGTVERTRYEKSLRQVAQSLAQGDFKYPILRGDLTEDDIFKALDSRFKDSVKTTGTLQQKTESTRGAEEQKAQIPDLNSINLFSKENPGSGKFFTYDKEGKRTGEFNVRPLADYQMSIPGTKKSIYERDPETGKVAKIDFNGIKLDNVQFLTEKGKEAIPGKVFAQLGEMTKLEDGTIVQKATVAVPTTTKTKDEFNKDVFVDTYTVQDRMIVIYSKDKGTGTKTEVLSNIKDEKARENYEAAFDKLKNWTGGSQGNQQQPGGAFDPNDY